MGTYLVTHGESSVVRGRSPQVGHKPNVEEVHNVEPAVQDEPTGLPVIRDKAGVTAASEGDRVEEEETEDHDDAA